MVSTGLLDLNCAVEPPNESCRTACWEQTFVQESGFSPRKRVLEITPHLPPSAYRRISVTSHNSLTLSRKLNYATQDWPEVGFEEVCFNRATGRD